MNMSISEYIQQHESAILETLKDFLRIASISAIREHDADCQRAAQWLVDTLNGFGFTAEAFPIPGRHPVVFAESPYLCDAPTLLIYGHYDVQPVDPRGEWKTEPFTPVIDGEMIFARGASDDKGPVMAHLMAARYWMQAENRPKLNVKFLLEGDEECENAGTMDFVREHTEMLACDYLALSDSSQFEPGQPSILCGLRGILGCELRLFGPQQDIHSGIFGGAISNPCNVLANVLAALKDPDGRITIPGFYDDVRKLTPEEAEMLRMLPFEEADFFDAVGVSAGTGERGFSVLERIWTRPTCDVNGISGGYQGEGPKTIIPAAATGKFSFRLVPGQSPRQIADALRTMLAGLIPPGIRWELDDRAQAAAVSVDVSKPCMKAAARAIEFGFGRSPLFTREGGSIPIVSTFSEYLTTNIMMISLSQRTDNIHAPNEHWSLADFHRGIKTSAKLWVELAGLLREAA